MTRVLIEISNYTPYIPHTAPVSIRILTNVEFSGKYSYEYDKKYKNYKGSDKAKDPYDVLKEFLHYYGFSIFSTGGGVQIWELEEE
jgi:hypothetical protein